MKHKLFIVSNTDWAFLSHRLPIALAAVDNNFDITILTKDSGRRKEIESYGFNFIEIPFNRSINNIFHEIKCIALLYLAYLKYKPDVIHHVYLKACIFGSIAAKLVRKKEVINAICGLGYTFTNNRRGIKQIIMKLLIKMALTSKKFHYIFQNPDDILDFQKLNLFSNDQIHLIKGTGIDLKKFTYQHEPIKKKIRFILPARMLYDKGVEEFVNAAKKIKKEVNLKAEFILVGDIDPGNPANIDKDKLLHLIDRPYIDWIGFRNNMFKELKNSHIVVLPSYREGLPKTLIEACALGRPIITTDSQGCRECVIDGYNGFLVPVKDVDILAEKMKLFIFNPEKRKMMGKNSRMLAEKTFSLTHAISEHFSIYNQLIIQTEHKSDKVRF